MRIQEINLKDYKPNPNNPRIDIDRLPVFYDSLKYSLQEYGYIEPIIVNEKTKHIVSGHQRVQVLLEQGVEVVQAVVVELDEKDENLLTVAINKIGGKWDYERLGKLLNDIKNDVDITKLGFDNSILTVLTEQFDMHKVIETKKQQILKETKQVISGRIGHYNFTINNSLYQKFLKVLEQKKPEVILEQGCERVEAKEGKN